MIATAIAIIQFFFLVFSIIDHLHNFICRFLYIHIITFSYQHHNKILCTDNLVEQL